MGEQRHHYTDEEREQAVRAYLALGTYRKAGELTGVTWQAIALWKHRDPQWWDEMVAKIQSELEEQYRAGWRNVLCASLNVMQDRLENGNHKLMKDGTIVRVPVEAKDAVVIGGIAADKLRVSMGLPNRITGKVEDNDRLDELRKLAEASRAARSEKGTDTLVEAKTIN